LQEEIIRNAVSAAMHDSRFVPLSKSEVETLSLSVEVLNVPELIESAEFLNPRKYGLIIEDRFGRHGVLLPGIEGVDTVAEQIRIVKRKAGINNDENLIFQRFTTTKFR
jgi:AMMECR1 domain-containing protein